MKRPSFQFYPSDWLRDTALRSCSMGARGLWMDMICYMHEGNPYGYLKVGDKVILNTGSFILCDVLKKLQLHECYLHTSEEILPATWKADLFGEEWHILASPNEDIFSAGEEGIKGNFNRVAKRLFDSQ